VKRALAVLAATAAVALAPPVSAQEPPGVQLFLTKQTPLATADQPLRITVAARNRTDRPLRNLTLSVAVHSPVRSRSEYAQFLEAGPTSALVARTSAVPGRIGPGGLRHLPEVELRLRDLAALGDSALYPVTVQLQSAGSQVAVLSSVLVFIVEEPLTPLLVSVSFVLDAPVRVRPDGTFVDDSLERQVQPPDGRLQAIVSALEAVPGVNVTLVVSPVLLEQLQAMRDGYRVAEAGGARDVPAEAEPAVAAGLLLDRIREVARQPEIQVVALPYASPSVPALVHADLESDLGPQIRRGREAVAAQLGKEPHAAVFRPPGSALTASSLLPLAEALTAEVGTLPALLLDGDVLPPPPPDPLTPPATAEIEMEPTAEVVRAIGSDPLVEARTRSLPDDPILQAHHTLGELSAIYFEQPGVPRGAALVFGENDAPRAGFLRSLLRGIQGEPGAAWLRPVTASRLLESDQPPPDRRELDNAATRPSPLAGSFTSELAASRDAVDALDSMADQPELIGNLDRMLLLSESRYLARYQDVRLAYLDTTRSAVRTEFGKVHLPEATAITLTSRTGRIPLTLRSDAGYPVQLVLSLRAPGLELIGGPSRDITLDRPIQTFVFPARAQRTGRFPVEVRLGTPDGTAVGDTEIVVRSTAYNRIALVVTIGAALFLAVWWGRRFLSRTKT
jgi:Family of unknown function (DUF6049)